MFPILMTELEWEKENFIDLPKTLPIEFVKQFEKGFIIQLGKDVDELIKQGGLPPTVFCACMYNMPMNVFFGNQPITDRQVRFSINMISLKLKSFERSKSK